MEHNNLEVTKIYGYCDTVDDSKYNRELAMRRANTMLTYFKKEIPVADSVVIKSFGKDFKYSKNQDENRKVEVFMKSSKRKSLVQNLSSMLIIFHPLNKLELKVHYWKLNSKKPK